MILVDFTRFENESVRLMFLSSHFISEEKNVCVYKKRVGVNFQISDEQTHTHAHNFTHIIEEEPNFHHW